MHFAQVQPGGHWDSVLTLILPLLEMDFWLLCLSFDRVDKVDKMSLDVIIMDNARLPTRTLNEAFEKNTHFCGLKFGGCTRLLVLCGGKIHFLIILSFGLSVLVNTNRFG